MRSRTTRTASRSCPTGRPSSSTTATGCSSRPAPAKGPASRDEEYAAAGATVVATADEVFAAADLIVKVKEPIPAEYHRFRDGQQLFTYLHLAADTRAHGVPAGTPDRLDRVRDRADPRPQTPAAHADERGGRPDGRAGRRPRAGVARRRRRHPARRRPRHAGRARHHHRRRCLRHRGGQDRHRDARHRPGPRHQPGPARLPVRRVRWAARPGHPQPRRHRRLGGRIRRRHRRRPRPWREGAEAGHPGDDRHHATRQRRGRHRHRPGRLLRDQPADDALRSRRTSRRGSCTTAWPTSPARSPAPPPSP